jgi:YfiH family protein
MLTSFKLMLEKVDRCEFSCQILPELEQISDFTHGFTDRQPGITRLDDLEDRNFQLLRSLGIGLSRIGMLEQVHSDRVLVIAEPSQWRHWPQTLGRGDGVIALIPGVIPVIRTADCIPVIAVVPQIRAVALFHAGWRGLRSRIVSGGLRLLMEAAGVGPDQITVAIGPCIRGCCYEVGPDVLQAFEDSGFDSDAITDGRRLDLPEVARIQAEQVGVSAWIDPGVCCACRNDLFYSYRKERTSLRIWTFAGFMPG